jgi:prepilin-type N-terminal cleavage/methylation domain-containing protein
MSAGVRASRRGFTLMELMVVIIIVGIVSALAIPSMLAARTDRHAYDDAGQIMQLFRDARTRAVGRGGAVLVHIQANNPGTTFDVWEAVTTNPGGVGGPNLTPVASCKVTPTGVNPWVPLPANGPANGGNTNISYVEGLNLNGPIEQQYGIQTVFNVFANPTAPATEGFLCITPLGRTYFSQAAPVFGGQLPMLTPLELQVTRAGGATIRSVLIPPNGMARVFSHTT